VTSRTEFFPRSEWLSLGSLVAVVSGLTAAERARMIPLSVLAASPHAVAESRVWLLLTSALLVQSPLFWSLVAFALLGALALEVCGPRAFWVSALAGHIGSTLVVYALLGFARTFDPHAFQAVLKAPDYGVSAISAAWLGAIASVSWQARGRTPRGKIATALAVVATALFGWMLHTHVSFLDLEHVVAFVIGIAVAVRLSRSAFSRPLAVGTADR
jgi:type IV secretory pathway VirB2 component (pilin)